MRSRTLLLAVVALAGAVTLVPVAGAQELKKDKDKLKSHHKPDAKRGGVPRSAGTPSSDGEPTFDEVVNQELRPAKRRRG